MNQEQIKANMLSTTFWVRVLFMAIFALVLWALWLAVIVICIVQTLIVLITGEINAELKKLGSVAAAYLGQVVGFMVFATEEKPFPFSPFPGADTSQQPAADTAPVVATAAPAAQAKPEHDDDNDGFYDPQRDSGAAR
ncbi:MAG TPA: DUF4389 domain-containing protein [Candidatus Acidoferrum sp.]|nr:DUF4389 domain-containing protein [Candidatus Acidoferrum sp.]